MLPSVFEFFISCLSSIIHTLKSFPLTDNLNFFDFLVFLLLVNLLYKLIQHIKPEDNKIGYQIRYDEKRKDSDN